MMMVLRMLVVLGSWSATLVLGMSYDDGAVDVGCLRLAVCYISSRDEL